MITEKHVFVTDDGHEFKTKETAERYEADVDKIAKLKSALSVIEDFCRWYKKTYPDTCVCYGDHKCPLFDFCKKSKLTEPYQFTNFINNLSRTMPKSTFRFRSEIVEKL